MDLVNVSKRFGDFMAVDSVSLAVEPGEVVGLLGANGAGKTTLMKLLLGLHQPSAGTIRLFGESPALQHRRRIGYVPQNLGLYPDLSIGENLHFRADVFGGSSEASESEADALLVGDLPMGTQRQAAFRAALQHRPDLLVLDEPTSGVSALARSELWDVIHRESERGAGVLVSTHYMDEADQADRLVIMAHGAVVATGRRSDVVAGRVTLSITADDWAGAFRALEAHGHRPLLAGRTVRLAADSVRDAAKVREVLRGEGVSASVEPSRATLGEALIELSS